MDPMKPVQEAKPRLLFRPEALEHHLRAQDPKEPLRVSPPWTWRLLAGVGALAVGALLLAFLWPVEVSGRSKGILRPVAGVRVIQAPVAGTLGPAFVRSGDPIQAGSPLARIEAPTLQGGVLEADRRLALLQQAGAAHEAGLEAGHLAQAKSLAQRRAAQERQMESHRRSVEVQSRRVEAQRRLLEAGLVSKAQVEEAQDALESGRRQEEGSRQALEQLRQEEATLRLSLDRGRWERQQTLGDARAKREALGASLDQAWLRSPIDGWVEAFVARPGDLLAPGQPVAKLVPRDSPLRAVAFVPEKDRPFLQEGTPVELELEALPYTEFGTLKGRILRLGVDLAAPHEVREALGEEAKLEGPTVRMEVELVDPRPKALAQAALRSGMLLQVRYTLRRKRVASMVFAPLQAWLD